MYYIEVGLLLITGTVTVSKTSVPDPQSINNY